MNSGMTRWRAVAGGLGVLAAVACGSGEPTATEPAAAPARAEAPAPAGVSEAVREEARAVFTGRCVTCHGPQGGGDGPASAGLTPPPRDFRDAAWQAEVTDEHIERIIQYGGAAVGRSPAMPGNPDLGARPQVVTALREHIRSLASR